MNPDLIKLQEKLGKGKSVIGLYVGTASVNAAQVVDYKDRPTLIKTAVETLDLKKGENTDRAILSALRKIFAQFPYRRATIICVIQNPQIFVRKMITPPMPQQEVGPAVELALKNALPFSLNEAIWSFRLVNKFSIKGMERFNILVAACPREVTEKIQTLLWGRKVKSTTDDKNVKRLGIKVDAYIPSAIALENLVGKSKANISETIVVIEFGATVTELNIYRNAHLEYSRKLPVTGLDLTKSMTGALFSDTGKTELTLEEAEEIKKEYGIPKDTEEQVTEGKITTRQIFLLIKPKIEQLVTEINRSLDYYREELYGDKVDRVLLFGGASQLKRLDEFLSAELGLEVRRGNPLENIALLDPSLVASDNDAQKLVLALGAALGDAKGINLLPKEFTQKKQQHIKTNMIQAAACAAVVVMSAAYLLLGHQIKIHSEQLRLQKAQLAPQLKKINGSLAIRRLTEQRPAWEEIFKLFSHMPLNMYLSELNLKDDQLHIKGIVLEEKEDSKLTIAHFIAGLQKNIFKDARLVSYKKNPEEGNRSEFEITAGINKVK